MKCDVIRECSGTTIPPDFAALHTGYNYYNTFWSDINMKLAQFIRVSGLCGMLLSTSISNVSANEIESVCANKNACEPLEILAAVICGADAEAGEEKNCRTILLQDNSKAAYLRQLGAHYVVTAFTELGSVRLRDDSDRETLAAGLLERVKVAEKSLHEACTANSTDGMAGSVTYPLDRADAIIAVGDVIEAGTRPSRRRLASLITNPLDIKNKLVSVFKNIVQDRLYAQAYRESFQNALKGLKDVDEKVNEKDLPENFLLLGRLLITGYRDNVAIWSI